MATILGIDPGSRKTGYGVIRMEGQRMHYVASGFIRITGDTLADKLQQVYAGVSEVIAQYQPTQFAIEQVFMAKNADSALKLGQARGVAIVAAANVGLPVSEYAARLIKQAVAGTGAATKVQVQQMVAAMLKLSDLPQSDAADALAIAICHANTNLGLVARAGKSGGRRSSSWRQFRPE